MQWYDIHKRDLPWRETSDPYKIWLSEIMLQQTRVNQGLPYYLKFIEEFPTVEDMAVAAEDKILRLWQGLGYYSRAKNLHKCAQLVAETFGGKFPNEYVDLLKLPGVGPYTAAAISSIAFNKPHAVIDGNVMRVISRYMGIADNIAEPAAIKKIHLALENLIDTKRPGLFNQALMELGSLVCKPQNPDCQQCPVAASCYANHHQLQNKLPFKQKKVKRKSRYFNYWVLVSQRSIALRKRDSTNIWRGLYEFYVDEKEAPVNGEIQPDPFLSAILKNDQPFRIIDHRKHVLSHQDIYATFIVLNVDNRQKARIEAAGNHVFYTMEEIMELPKPILIDKFLREKIFD